MTMRTCQDVPLEVAVMRNTMTIASRIRPTIRRQTELELESTVEGVGTSKR